jgi:hypothetical protein
VLHHRYGPAANAWRGMQLVDLISKTGESEQSLDGVHAAQHEERAEMKPADEL